MSKAVAINKENQVYSIACTICFPKDMRLIMYTSKNPEKSGCSIEDIAKVITYISKKESDTMFLI